MGFVRAEAVHALSHPDFGLVATRPTRQTGAAIVLYALVRNSTSVHYRPVVLHATVPTPGC